MATRRGLTGAVETAAMSGVPQRSNVAGAGDVPARPMVMVSGALIADRRDPIRHGQSMHLRNERRSTRCHAGSGDALATGTRGHLRLVPPLPVEPDASATTTVRDDDGAVAAALLAGPMAAPRQSHQSAKRAFDLIVALVLAVLTLPLVLILLLGSLVVYRANPIFLQRRVGLGGREFWFAKIRSLPPSTPAYTDKYTLATVTNNRWGRLLRRSKLDELPQLWHVVFGRMSMVGPRPEMPELSAAFDRHFVDRRLSVRPGCSGLWQISPDSAMLIGEAPQWDLHYVDRRTLRLDLWVIVATIASVAGWRPLHSLGGIPQWTGAAQTIGLTGDGVPARGATRSLRMHRAFRCCGVRIDAIPLDQAALLVAGGQALGAVHLCNAYTLSLALRDPSLAGVLADGTLNLPDGMPLVWIARRLGLTDMTERVYGPDLMERALEVGSRFGTRHVLFGSTPEVLAALEERVAERWPDASIVGTMSPPFSNSMPDFDVVLHMVAEQQADVVWVGLGTPKQDLVVARLAERAAAEGIAATFVAIGAAFDFIAGTKRQAPAWMQRRGLEWFHRLMVEPRRLWKRYLVGNSRFIWGVARARSEVLVAGTGTRHDA